MTTDEKYRERARRLAAMLIARPERHYQSTWVREEPDNECGTAACIAGWATLIAAGEVEIDAEGTMTWDKARQQEHDGTLAYLTAGLIPEYAGREYLGLSADVASALFDGDQEEVDAVAFLSAIASGRVDRVAYNDDDEPYSEFRDRLIADATQTA